MKKIILLCSIFFLYTVASASTVDTVSIFSKSMQKYVKCVVIKPDNYKKKKNHFPVVYLLHGYSDKYSGWLEKVPGLHQLVDASQVIVVCPDGNYDSWYFDSPMDNTSKYETNVAEEIPAYIDTHYRTIRDRKARAITGLSMGGHGALYLAARHTDIFGAAGSMSGGVDIRPFPDNWNIKKYLGTYAGHPDNWNKNTVINAIDSLHNDELKLIIDCGIDDFFIQVNRDLHQKLLTLKINHDYTERPGVHNWDYWANAIKYQLLFFGEYFKGK